jgi:dimethylglycine dehydrogenase
MKTHARVVVIGGGAVGVSTLYHLTLKGWSDVVLLERSELTAGSTWHAAGLLPLFNMSYTVGQLHKYSVDLYKRLPAETGQDVSFHVTGNLRLATNRDRMDEYLKYCGTANTIGVPFQVIGPEEVKKLWPLVELGGKDGTPPIVGALYHPDDGHIAPARAGRRSTSRPRSPASAAHRPASGVCRPTKARSSPSTWSARPVTTHARPAGCSASTCPPSRSSTSTSSTRNRPN